MQAEQCQRREVGESGEEEERGRGRERYPHTFWSKFQAIVKSLHLWLLKNQTDFNGIETQTTYITPPAMRGQQQSRCQANSRLSICIC